MGLPEHHPRLRQVVVQDARDLDEGETDQTPAIAIMGVVLFLLPMVAVMMGIALAAYYGIG